MTTSVIDVLCGGAALVLVIPIAVPLGARAAEPIEAHSDSLTGDWSGGRTWLKEHGVTVRPRLTQFYQGLVAGDGEHGFEYGGKLDLLIATDLNKLGLWNGFSMNIQADYNFGKTVNGSGGVLIPVNTALNSPGMEGADAFDVSSFYFGQSFGDAVSLLFGKINMIELVAGAPFMGGAGIDSFWNHTFTATPSGTVPPYLLGVLSSVPTDTATYRLWIYDPNSVANEPAFADAFDDGVSIRGSVDFNVTLAGRPGHQGFAAFYSTKDGTDLESLGDILLPTPSPGTVDAKDSRHYFAYSFNQLLHAPGDDPEQGFGLFGNVGVSDGNPNGLHWSMYLGVGGKGLIPGRRQDAWGAGYYYDGLSQYLEDVLPIGDEQGLELFYDFALSPWCHLGVDLQIVDPGLGSSTVVVPGLRAVVRL